jgi:TolB-like protein
VVIAAVIALFFVFPPEWLFERLAEQSAEVAVPRIVVLPFENLGSPDDEYFADGITEEITSRLAAVSGLQVISRASAVQYKGTDKTINQIGEELNVQYAVEGTVRWERLGEGLGRVRITPQLISVPDDSHVWSDRYDRAIESVFEVQSDIAAKVVGQLHVNLLQPEQDALEARPTENLEAYEAYLRARHHTQVNDYDQAQLALAMYQRAVDLDSGFAAAWSRLAITQTRISSLGWDRSGERCTAAQDAAERALELDPGLPEGHVARGLVYYQCNRDYENALAEFQRALGIRANYLDALVGQAWVLRRQGRWKESTALLERGLELSPMDSRAALDLSGNLRAMRDFGSVPIVLQKGRRAMRLR